MRKKTGWEKVGTIGVDAGLCWLGDPCYVLGDDASHRVENWSAFCKELREKENDGTAIWDAGISVSTGYGDGEYPVYVKRDKYGKIAEAKVVFIY